MHFTKISVGSTADNITVTGGEDEEEHNLHQNAFTKFMMTTGMRRKRFAESDGGDLSVSCTPATKKRAVMDEVYVDIPVRSANVSVWILPELSWASIYPIIYFEVSKDKGKGRAPSNSVVGLEDGFIPNSEAGSKYDRLVTLQGESDNGDSEFEASDEEEEDRDRDVTLRNGHRIPSWASCAGVDHFNDLEEEDAVVFYAAIRASIRDPVNGDASTSAGSAFAPVTTVHRFVMEGFTVDSDIVPDNHFEGEVLALADSRNELVMQRADRGKTRCGDESQATVTVPVEYDADGLHRGYVSEGRNPREGRGPYLVDEQEGRTFKYQLGRHLTHIDLAASFHWHVPRFVCRQ
jgi:hypothetical protein